MEIVTKFNINDEVWFVHPLSKKAVSGRIKGINIRVDGKPKYRHGEKRDLIRTGEYEKQLFVHTYTIDDQISRDFVTKSEYDLFTNKEDLKDELKRRADRL